MANIVCYDSDGQLLSHYTQWDVNQKLVIAGADISSAPDFHFLNTLQRDAYVVKSQISGNFLIASVPDELLQHDVPIIAHIYYVPGTTEYTIRIPVMPRRKPDNYIYTDTESGGGGSAGGQVYIANNLTTNDPDMALSAAQGVVIKKSIEDLDKNKVSVDQMNTAIEDALVDFDVGSGTSGSGGGIAVTGAKVGQTVKIASVDENGVPTAWEPTDFPSGGGSGGLIVVNVEYNDKNELVADNTFAEIYNAFSNGWNVVVWHYGYSYIPNYAQEDYIEFTAVKRTDNGYVESAIEIGEDYIFFNENLIAGGNVELDTTLTQSGKAADAKAVGDVIKGLRSYIDDEILGGAW